MQGHFAQTTKNYINYYCTSKNVRKACLTWRPLKGFRGFAKLARKKSWACFLKVSNQVKIPVASNLFWSWSFHFLNLLFCDNILVTFCISPFQKHIDFKNQWFDVKICKWATFYQWKQKPSLVQFQRSRRLLLYFILQKTLGPLFMEGFNCLKATELLRVRSLKIIWTLFLGHRQEDESGLPQFKQVFLKTTGWHECSFSNL